MSSLNRKVRRNRNRRSGDPAVAESPFGPVPRDPARLSARRERGAVERTVLRLGQQPRTLGLRPVAAPQMPIPAQLRDAVANLAASMRAQGLAAEPVRVYVEDGYREEREDAQAATQDQAHSSHRRDTAGHQRDAAVTEAAGGVLGLGAGEAGRSGNAAGRRPGQRLGSAGGRARLDGRGGRDAHAPGVGRLPAGVPPQAVTAQQQAAPDAWQARIDAMAGFWEHCESQFDAMTEGLHDWFGAELHAVADRSERLRKRVVAGALADAGNRMVEVYAQGGTQELTGLAASLAEMIVDNALAQAGAA